jgi:hypothetical protein
LVVSVGGNDALPHINLLYENFQPSVSLLTRLAETAQGFAVSYRKAILALKALSKPLCLCRIYISWLMREL